MPAFRNDAVRRIRQDGDFDAVVVGGGINGIATYRDLALQGLRVLLVERGDFASGCSAAPSRMIHGGLRYLENGEFGLVAESLRERDALLALAPHMVHPLPTTIPIMSFFSGLFNAAAAFAGSSGPPTSRGAVAIKIGLALYDLVTRKRRRLPRHEFRSRTKTLQKWPRLTPALRCSATYHDAWIRQPERLAVELIVDTARDAPKAIALNYAEMRHGDDGYHLVVEGMDGTLPIRPRAIVNATGAFIDVTARTLGRTGAEGQPIVSGTKGSHLILDSPELYKALNGHMIFFENRDNRVCILFPYLGRVLAGSTDIKVERPERVRCEPEERDYILEAIRSVFPGIPIEASDIVFSFSGIRPLPRSDAAFTGRISRSHFVHRIEGDPPQFCMVGGKWTTFRAFAEQTADDVLAHLGRRRTTGTLTRAIGGGRDFPGSSGRLAEQLRQRAPIDANRATHLAETYGSRAFDLLDFNSSYPGDRPLLAGLAMTEAEIAWLIRSEYVRHLGDLALRRTDLAITGAISLDLIGALARIAARELGWSEQQAAAEQARLLDELDAMHGVSRTTLENRCKEHPDETYFPQSTDEPSLSERRLP